MEGVVTYFVQNVNIVNNILVMIVENGLLVSVGKSGYFCIGNKRYGCTHGYCHELFWEEIKEKMNQKDVELNH